MIRLLGSAGSLAGTLAFFILLGSWSPGLGCVAAFAVTSIVIGMHWWYAAAHRWVAAHQKTLLALKRGNCAEAEIHARQALVHAGAARANGPLMHGASLCMLGAALHGLKGGGDLIPEFQAALASAPEHPDLKAMLTSQLGVAMVDAGRWSEAEIVAGDAARLAEENGSFALRTGAVYLLADLDLERGRLAQAAHHLRNAIALVDQSGDATLLSDLPNLHLSLGNTYAHAAQPGRAVAEYETALDGHEAGDPGGFASSRPLLNLAVALSDLGRFTEAISQGRRGLAIRRRFVPEDDASLALFWITLAVSHARAGNAGEARASLTSAQRSWPSGLDADVTEAVLSAQGYVLQCEGDGAGAEAAFVQFHDQLTARKGIDHPCRIEPLSDLERHYTLQGRAEDAARCRQEIDRLKARLGDV